MNKKKHTQIQRILRLENIVTQLYIKVDALKTIIDKPKDPKVTQRPNTSSSWQTFNKTEKEKAKFYEDQEQKELEHQEKVRGVQN